MRGKIVASQAKDRDEEEVGRLLDPGRLALPRSRHVEHLRPMVVEPVTDVGQRLFVHRFPMLAVDRPTVALTKVKGQGGPAVDGVAVE